MNKPVYLDVPIVHLSKTVMYQFWYNYVNTKYDEKAKLCYIDTDSLIVHVKTDDTYKDIAEDVETSFYTLNYELIVHVKTDDIYKDIAADIETRFYTLNYELNKPLSKVKSKRVISVMKDEFGGKIMKEFVELRAKAHIYLIDDGSEGRKAKATKSCIIKRKLKFEVYKHCLEATQLENKINLLEKIILMWIIFKKIIKNS